MTGVSDHGSGFPKVLRIPIRLDDDPGYRGSVHDGAVARRMGFKAALVPGAFIYGHVSRIAVDAWGVDWIRRGRMGARFRRPVYDGDVLTAEVSALADSGADRRSEVSLCNEEGEEVATGWVGMPLADPMPPKVADCPVLPLPSARRRHGPAGGTVRPCCRAGPSRRPRRRPQGG